MTDNHDPAVDAWFEDYDNPQKPLVLAVREVVLGADPRVSEAIKWKAPTFMYRGNIASFYPRSKQHVSLMFHTGASLPDPTGCSRARATPPGSRASSTPTTWPPSPVRCAGWSSPGSRSAADR